ncbi:MAG: hypothetical protein ACI8VT_003385, partial [Saprospiraceae bacterium]
MTKSKITSVILHEVFNQKKTLSFLIIFTKLKTIKLFIMKTNFTRIKTAVIATFLALFLSANLYAQPANDDCVNAIAVTVGTDEATCVSSSGSTVGGTPSTEPLSVCSGSWFGDDIWFSFETGATIPADGLTIKAFYGTEPGDLGQAGMGLYASCDVNESPLL